MPDDTTRANQTREEFEAAYAARSGITVEQLRLHRHVVHCDCGKDGCEGWAMVPLDFTNHRGIDGYDEFWNEITPDRASNSPEGT